MKQIKINLLDPQVKPKRKIWPYIFLFFAVLLILGVTNYASSIASLNKISHNSSGKKPSFFTQLRNLILSPDKQLQGEADDRINILLLGIGGEGHDGPYLSDTILLLSIQPSTHQVASISIPRDLLVDIPGYGFGKINAADAVGESKQAGSGPILASQIIGKVINQPIQYYVRADFQAFKELVDEVGGVKIYVDKTFSDYQFPTYDYKYQTVSFEKGWQDMDGERALQFSRSRHGNNGEGSDFARSRRQQKLLLALKDKIFSADTFFNPGRLENIAGSLSNHIQTNIEPWEMLKFMKIAQKLDYENMINKVIDVGTNSPLLETFYNGASVLVTRDDSFDEVQHIVQNIFSATPEPAIPPPTEKTVSKNQPSIIVQNGTWILGLAAKTKVALEEKGYLINDVGNASLRNYPKTTIYDLSLGRYTSQVEKLKNYLQAEILKQLPPELMTSSTPDILIIVGEDKNK